MFCVHSIYRLANPPDCLVGHQMSLQHTRECIWIFEQSVQGLIANLGKSTVCRGKDGEGRSPVQDVSSGSVVEGCSKSSYERGEAVVSGQSLVQGEGASGGL